jgi:hypothetical protein
MDEMDIEIQAIYDFCIDGLKKLDRPESTFAVENGLNPKDITKFKEHSNRFHKSKISFRNTYRILRGLLGHQPISTEKCNIDPTQAAKIKKIESSQYADLLNLVLDILANHDLANADHLKRIQGRLEVIKEDIEAAKEKAEAHPPQQKFEGEERRINMDPYHGPERREKAA